MKSSLEVEFHEEMVSIFRKSGKATGYWPRRFLQKVREVGGLKAAREWLNPEKGLSPGLMRLAKEKRLDLSMEALVLKKPWSKLFTEDEIRQARRRLAAVSKRAGRRLYTYNVAVSFNMQFTFTAKDVQPASESGEGGGPDEIDPTDKALADLEQEIREHLSERYSVSEVEAFADSDSLLGTMED